jgi:phasin
VQAYGPVCIERFKLQPNVEAKWVELTTKDKCHVGLHNQTTTAKPTSYSKMDATQLFRATAENGSAQVKESFERMSAATAEATAQIKDSYSTALKGAQDYNAKLFEFAQNNSKAAIEFVQKLSGVKSPTDFIELSTDHSRKQFETLIEQTKELAALAQKVTLATVEPIKTGVTKAFGQPT